MLPHAAPVLNPYRAAYPLLLATVADACCNPFEDVQVAAWYVVKGLAHTEWGRGALAKQPGFLETLLDREVTSAYEAKRFQYSAAQQLADSPPASLTEQQREQVTAYTRAGVLALSQPDPQVLLESAAS